MSDRHTWVIWEFNLDRRGWPSVKPKWKFISSHKTRVAAEIAMKRGFRRVMRRNSEGPPS